MASPFPTLQGKFTSDGTAKELNIRSDVDWMEVINYTQAATTQSTGRGVRFLWQRGFDEDAGLMYTKEDSGNALDLEEITSGGFTLLDTGDRSAGAEKTGTTITKADPGVATITSHGFSNGDIVRIYSSDTMAQINGLEFTISGVTTNTFELAYLNTNTSSFTAATEFKARKIANDLRFAPRRRVITNITQASEAVITFSVDHTYTVGEVVRVKLPEEFGMTEINDKLATVTAISTSNNTITVDIDSSAFTAFSWASSSDAPLTHAEVIPVGDEGADSFGGATENVSIVGMKLAAGADSPAGSNNDVIYWRAGSSAVVDNE